MKSSNYDISIVDTGINPQHHEFKGINIKRIYDPFEGDDSEEDGHGNHVVAIFDLDIICTNNL